MATYHGGGSASLAAYYAVTPFDGISSKLSSPPGYSVGAHSHKLLPLLGNLLKTPTGETGMLMKVYNEDPSVSDRECVDEIVVSKTELLLVDYYNNKLKSNTWYADFEGSFVPEEDREWDLSLIVHGTAKLFVNGELVVNNAENQVPGEAFFGMATEERKGRIQLKKGETYNIKVEFGSAATSQLNDAGVVFGGGCLRVGGCEVIDPKEEIAKAAALAKDAEQVIVCAGLNADWETEGNDREHMDLPGYLDEMIYAVAAANPNTVVVMQSGTPVTMPWIDSVPALVQAWYGGNETGNCIADVVFGDANPSGKLSLSFPAQLRDNPSYLNFRAEGGRTLYGEDVYVGYRYYEYLERPVLFPFGHGLSYTSFAFSGLSVEEKDGKVGVKLSVKNTGERKGAEVVQVYVSPKQKAKINRPVKEMRGFDKVELEAGEERAVSVAMETKYAVSYWDEGRGKWCAEKGDYEVIVSNSSAAEEGNTLRGSFSVAETFWWSGL